jgi:hypothetical protein
LAGFRFGAISTLAGYDAGTCETVAHSRFRYEQAVVVVAAGPMTAAVQAERRLAH